MTKLNLSFKSSLLSRSLHESQMSLAINEESSSSQPHATLPLSSRSSAMKTSSSTIDLQTEAASYHSLNWRKSGLHSITSPPAFHSLTRSHSPTANFPSFRHSSDFSRIVNEHSAHSDKQIYRHTKLFDDEEHCKRNQINQSNNVGNKQFYHYEGHHLDNNNNNNSDDNINNNCNDHKNKHDNNNNDSNCNGECINDNISNDNDNNNNGSNGNKNLNNSNNDYVRNMIKRNTLTNLSSTSNDKQISHSFHPSTVWTGYNVSTASIQPLRLDALSISNSSSRSSSSSSPVTIMSPTASITSNSSSQFLSSHIVTRKRKRTPQPIPEEYKDTAYWERRRRNNESAKRSREIRRVKEQETNIKVTMLERDNLRLKTEVVMLRSELEKLREILYCRERQAN